ncbi:hypothetical protein TSOC_002018 [Tetrabaena socialis]|uniref:Uncharacterized protein n=1 Tax=Tetrabaena socialis TaxID=47790 RepID=A0A2J8AF70_9CHLO|nr:hypothetical protein TSOC_002018 [Tetrabaena socialis]|eukprot:PNH11168.1 hypothetical protein TSOC_002018 [Tetrabaena socialis]
MGAWLLGMIPRVPYGELLPPAPPPALAAVLAAGLLPCLERLLRRAGEKPDGPESVVVAALLRGEHAWHLWAQLLEYGDAEQAVPLVVTLGRLLYHARPSAAFTAHTEASSFADGSLVVGLCAGLLDGVAPSRDWRQQGVSMQQEVVLMYAVRKWLPVLSRLARQAMAYPAAPAGGLPSVLLRPLLSWLPLLACRCWGGGGTAAAPNKLQVSAMVVDVYDPEGEFLDDGTGGWQALLAHTRVVALLGGALHLTQLPRTGIAPSLRAALAESCCTVAAACSDEVQLAAGSSAGWQPELLRALVPELRRYRHGSLAKCTEALATFLERLSAVENGNGGGHGNQVAHEGLLAAREEVHILAAKLVLPEDAAMLVPPAITSHLLNACPCRHFTTSLAGDSAAGGCGNVLLCSVRVLLWLIGTLLCLAGMTLWLIVRRLQLQRSAH